MLFREENFGQTGAPQAETTTYRDPPKLECRPIQDRNRTVKRAVKSTVEDPALKRDEEMQSKHMKLAEKLDAVLEKVDAQAQRA